MINIELGASLTGAERTLGKKERAKLAPDMLPHADTAVIQSLGWLSSVQLAIGFVGGKSLVRLPVGLGGGARFSA